MPSNRSVVPIVLTMLVSGTGCVDHRAQLLHTAGPLAADLADSKAPRLTRAQRPEMPSTGYKVSVRAWVDGHAILDEDVNNFVMPMLMQLRSLPEPQRTEKINEATSKALDRLIDEELLYRDAITKLEKNNPKALEKVKEAARQDFDRHIRSLQEANKLSPDEFKAILRKQGMTLEAIQRRKERDFIATEYLRSKIFPLLNSRINREMTQDYYETHKNEFQRIESVKWKNIFVAVGPKHPTLAAARQFAADLVSRCQRPEDFDGLLEHDDGDSKLRQGWGLGERRGEIQPSQLEEALFSLQPGQIGPLVELDTGVHIFRLVERVEPGFLPFDEKTQNLIKNKLRNEMAEREQRRVLADLRSRAVIQILSDTP